VCVCVGCVGVCMWCVGVCVGCVCVLVCVVCVCVWCGVVCMCVGVCVCWCVCVLVCGLNSRVPEPGNVDFSRNAIRKIWIPYKARNLTEQILVFEDGPCCMELPVCSITCCFSTLYSKSQIIQFSYVGLAAEN